MKKNTNKIIGANLRGLRKMQKVSQEKMGEILRVHQTAVCRIEKGIQALTPEQLKKASDFFEVSMRFFFEVDCG